MPQSYVQYLGNGSTTTFAVPFSYLNRAHVTAKVDGVRAGFTWGGDATINLSHVVPGSGAVVEVRRTTPNTSRWVDFVDGSTLTADDLDQNNTQSLYLSQEALDRADEAPRLTSQNTYDFQGRRATNLADPVNAQDAVTKTWAETSMTSQVRLASEYAYQSSLAAGRGEVSATAAKTAQTAAEYAAAHPDLSAALNKSQNLADVADKGTARGNLGLKGAAVLEVGQTAGTVAAGDDPRFGTGGSGSDPNAVKRGDNTFPGPNFATYTTAYASVTLGVNPLPLSCRAGGNTVGVTDVLLATVDLPYSDANPRGIHAAAVAGIARTADPNMGAVGLFGSAMPNQAPGRVAQVFGGNLVVTNKPNLVPNVPNQGISNVEMYGLEIDVACERLPNGAAPTNTHIRGTWVTGNCEVQPDGALIGHYVGFAGAFKQVPFKEGFRTMDGASETSFMAGLQPGSGAQGSAPFKMRSRDASNTERLGQISTDPGGNMVLAPGGGAAVVLAPGGIASAFIMRAGSLEVTGSAAVGGNATINGQMASGSVSTGTLAASSNVTVGGNATVNGTLAASTGSFGNITFNNVNVQLTASGGAIPPGYKALIVAG